MVAVIGTGGCRFVVEIRVVRRGKNNEVVHNHHLQQDCLNFEVLQVHADPSCETHIQTDRHKARRRTIHHETHPGYSSVTSTRADKCLLEVALRLATERARREATFIIARQDYCYQ
jgi:hypothetical protein